MTLSGDENGSLARMDAGVHGWVARGCAQFKGAILDARA